MANLLIEIGNTALKGAWAEGKTLGKTIRYQGEKVFGFIEKMTAEIRPEIMVVASKRDIDSQAENRLRACCRTLVLMDQTHRDLLRAYGLPEYLSPDRAASLVAARDLFRGKKCMVFDFGTIVSVDFLNEDGTYGGGNLSLGCRTRFKAMQRYSRSLPLVNTPKENPGKGYSLESSIEAGIVSGIKFEIDGYIQSSPDSVVLFTGGDANFLAKQTKSSIFVVCNLVLMGLATIADDYGK
ncbi:MAG: type III pantothenate kinase [Bacteroidales bacterium]|nr:type III pantothenate kinase [Bacteroidales bacterium]